MSEHEEAGGSVKASNQLLREAAGQERQGHVEERFAENWLVCLGWSSVMLALLRAWK